MIFGVTGVPVNSAWYRAVHAATPHLERESHGIAFLNQHPMHWDLRRVQDPKLQLAQAEAVATNGPVHYSTILVMHGCVLLARLLEKLENRTRKRRRLEIQFFVQCAAPSPARIDEIWYMARFL